MVDVDNIRLYGTLPNYLTIVMSYFEMVIPWIPHLMYKYTSRYGKQEKNSWSV